MEITFEGIKGSGMALSVTALMFYDNFLDYCNFSGSRNRRVICAFNPCKKYKHFDEIEYLRELEARELR